MRLEIPLEPSGARSAICICPDDLTVVEAERVAAVIRAAALPATTDSYPPALPGEDDRPGGAA